MAEHLKSNETEVSSMLYAPISIKDIADVNYEDGIENGREKGIAVGYKNVAIRMIKANKPDFEILEMTELPLSEIQKLREQYA